MFFWRISKVTKNKINPLQVQKRTLLNGIKRTSRSASDTGINHSLLHGKHLFNMKKSMINFNDKFSAEEGSVTVEAAMIIPLLLCVFMGIMMWQQVFLIHQDIESALLETARQLARKESGYEEDREGTTLLQAGILFYSNYNQGDSSYGVKVKGITLLGSEYRKMTKEVYLQARYELQIPLFLLGTWRLPLTASVVQKAWNGYAPLMGEVPYGEEYVYVTEDGEVYHKSGQCYHLHVHIEETQNVEAYYNGKSGLRPCGYCVDGRGKKDVLYIPEEGECYHEDSACGSITRSVSYKKKSETGGRRPCKDCVVE